MEQDEKKREAKEHELKCWPPYFADICEWQKSFELRKADRDYKVGDTLWLREWDPTTESYTDSECVREIGYILLGDAETSEWGLAPGYCILGLKPYDNRARLRARITELEALPRESFPYDLADKFLDYRHLARLGASVAAPRDDEIERMVQAAFEENSGPYEFCSIDGRNALRAEMRAALSALRESKP